MSKSKVLKTDRLGALSEVKTSKKRTPLWRQAHVEVKKSEIHTTFGPFLDVHDTATTTTAPATTTTTATQHNTSATTTFTDSHVLRDITLH